MNHADGHESDGHTAASNGYGTMPTKLAVGGPRMNGIVAWFPFTLAAAFLALTGAILLWDVLASLGGLNGAPSASDVIAGWMRTNPVLTLLIGILLGHLFWRQ